MKPGTMLKLTTLFLLAISVSASAQINMIVKNGGFLFMEGKDSILFYRKTPANPSERCNYISSLYGINGKRIATSRKGSLNQTEGIFWGWPQVLIDNKQVSDTWAYKNIQQKVSNFEFVLNNGNGLVTATSEWKSPKWKDEKEPYLKENIKINIHRRAGNYRKIDLEIELKALTDRVAIARSENGDGGFSMTFPQLANATIVGEKNISASANGPVDAGKYLKSETNNTKDGKTNGIVLSQQSNKGYFVDREKKLLSAIFPGDSQVAIPFGKPLVLKFTLLVFQQEFSEKQIEKALREK